MMALFKRKIYDELEIKMLSFFVEIKNQEIKLEETKDQRSISKKAYNGLSFLSGGIGVLGIAAGIAKHTDLYPFSSDVLQSTTVAAASFAGLATFSLNKYNTLNRRIFDIIESRQSKRYKNFTDFEKALVEKIGRFGTDVNYAGVLKNFDLAEVLKDISQAESKDLKNSVKTIVEKLENTYENENITSIKNEITRNRRSLKS